MQATARAVTATATEIEVDLTRSTDRIAELGRRRDELAAEVGSSLRRCRKSRCRPTSVRPLPPASSGSSAAARAWAP